MTILDTRLNSLEKSMIKANKLINIIRLSAKEEILRTNDIKDLIRTSEIISNKSRDLSIFDVSSNRTETVEEINRIIVDESKIKIHHDDGKCTKIIFPYIPSRRRHNTKNENTTLKKCIESFARNNIVHRYLNPTVQIKMFLLYNELSKNNYSDYEAYNISPIINMLVDIFIVDDGPFYYTLIMKTEKCFLIDEVKTILTIAEDSL